MSKTKKTVSFSDSTEIYSVFGRSIGMPPLLEQDYAMKTCRDWTNTRCQNASQIIPMLEKYAKLRKTHKLGIEIPKKDKEGYDNIENYRRKGIKHWREALSQPYKIPSMGEMVLTSTFHWSIYNMNKTITKENDDIGTKIYNDMITRIELKDGRDDIHNIDFINSYRKTIEPEFERIQHKINNSESKTSWNKWFKFLANFQEN